MGDSSTENVVTLNNSNRILLKPLRVLFCVFLIVAIHLIALATSTPAFAQLVINALTCIYIGCFLSSKVQISMGLQHEKSEKGKLQRFVNIEDEKMQKKDALMFPVIGSCVLFGLYTLYKFFDKIVLNYAFSLYFSFIGIFSVTKLFESLIASIAPRNTENNPEIYII